MLRRDTGMDEEIDTSDIDNLVVVLGGPKGRAYQLSFRQHGDYEAVTCDISALPHTDSEANTEPKLQHRGSAAMSGETSVTLSGMSWVTESNLATFFIDSDGSSAVGENRHEASMDAVPVRYAAQKASSSEMGSERAEVVQYAGTTPDGYLLRYHGSEQEVIVRTLTEHRLSQHMKVPEAKDTSNFIMCPMPGTLISLKAEAGQSVTEGQEVAVIEAMKMQNVLRSPKDGVIKSVNCPVGSHLRVDQVIIEFEGIIF